MTVMTDTTTGAQLAQSLLKDVGDEREQAATRLLGAHHDGVWLRRFTGDPDLAAAAGRPLIDRTGACPVVDWAAVRKLRLSLGWSRRASTGDLAVLEFACSLLGSGAIELRHVMGAVDRDTFRLLLRALEEAARADSPDPRSQVVLSA
ncbi:hypothetical protein GCM10010277_09870 [Streptomyces longisporoflavus]|uniref:hypothetical protein n=1 Tax=Streptomyces longisporoflavus TaxID=28044 RepID=UPI00167C61AE|nr:hypothetical protein [Streptomyces longisporoflavus]GGV27979.1 hypothetical protein GCM10010277_09870 [Streptomyces longisporoflavus]